MSRQITQPINQVRLTNVAVVRLSTHGHRFEIACYRNKIINYRQGIETDLSEVLQTDRVFTNVSKGQFAKQSDLVKCFGTRNEEEVCEMILKRGNATVQVSDMERSAQLESTTREVAGLVATKCVDPASNRPYTTHQIRDAMSRAEFCVHPTRSVKQQFLDCVRLIREKGVLPLERAKMELCVVLRFDDDDDDDGGDARKKRKERIGEVVERLRAVGVTLDDESEAGNGNGSGLNNDDEDFRLTFLIDPSLYRQVDAVVKDVDNNGNGHTSTANDATSNAVHVSARLEIVRQCVTATGDVNLESEVQRKKDWKDRENAANAAARRVEGAAAEVQQQQQRRGSDNGNDEGSDNSDDNDEDVAALARRTAAAVNIRSGNDDNNDDAAAPEADEEQDVTRNSSSSEAAIEPQQPATTTTTTNSRRANKKAQKKKSKKAKRREKEEAAERRARVEAERVRQAERAARLGIIAGENGNGSNGNDSNGSNEDATAGSSASTGNDTGRGITAASATDGTTTSSSTTSTTTTATTNGTKSCNTCGGSFTAVQYRSHFRSDWHRYNLKLKMGGSAPISEEEFRLCDEDVLFD